MINRSLASAKSFSSSPFYPGLVGRVNTVDCKALTLLEVPIELVSQSFKVALLHPAAMYCDDAELLQNFINQNQNLTKLAIIKKKKNMSSTLDVR
jgi:hypothetical protein